MSQLPVDTWHAYLGEPTLADAILDRLVHNAYRMPLKGESMRKKPGHLTADKLGDQSDSRPASLRSVFDRDHLEQVDGIAWTAWQGAIRQEQ